MLFKKYYIVTGKGESETSSLNAFDAALVEAGISQCNIVPVSSILPPDAERIEPIKPPPGTITFTVIAREDGFLGETIGAGIGWGFDKNYGLVAEDKSQFPQELEANLKKKLREMASARNMSLENPEFVTEKLPLVTKKHGCVIAALVYCN